MANTVNITIAAQDQASKVLSGLGSKFSQMSAQAAMANPKVADLAAKLAIARTRLDEASASAKTKASVLMNLQHQVSTYENQLKQAITTEDEAADSGKNAKSSWVALAASALGTGLSVSQMAHYLNDSTTAANQFNGALIGLSTVSRAYGQDASATTAAAQSLAQDGFMSVTEAANGLKNLIASGFSLDQAMQLMTALKNQAAFNRQSFYGLGEAVVATTEGIKNGNSVLADATGTTKNLSVMAQEAGASIDQMGSISQNAGYRQAVFNGFMTDASRSMGDLTRLSETAAGADARLAQAKLNLQVQVGNLANAIKQPLVGAMADFINNHQRMIISIGAGAAVTLGLVTAVGLATAAIQTFGIAAIVSIVTNPVFLALSALAVLAGVVVYKAVNKMQDSMAQSNQSANQLGGTLGNTVPSQSAKASKAMGDLAKRLEDISEQSTKAERDFRENLAQMVKDHEDKVRDLQSQLASETASYQKEYDKQSADFATSQQQQADEHQKRVDKIQQQLDDELALGKWADQTKIADLQAQLAEENTQYDQQAAQKKAQYDQDVADNKASHDQKMLDLQTQLDTENALLTKHAADVASIRNVTLLDEIDKLKRSHDEQVAAFARQKNDAIANAQQTADGVSGVWSNANAGLNNQFAGLGNSMGTQMGNAFKAALKSALSDVGNDIGNWAAKVLTFIGQGFSQGVFFNMQKGGGNKSISQLWNEISSLPAFRASGGPVTSGQPYIVGEEGPELIVPRGSGTVIPADQTSKLMSGGVTMNQVNHIYNQFDLTQANRELSYKLVMKAA